MVMRDQCHANVSKEKTLLADVAAPHGWAPITWVNVFHQ